MTVRRRNFVKNLGAFKVNSQISDIVNKAIVNFEEEIRE